MKFKCFGWRGFQTLIPENWEMTTEGRGASRTYLRLEDEHMIRLELRWDEIPPKKRPNVKESLDSFLKELKEKVEKANLKFSCLAMREASINDHEGYIYHIRGGTELFGASWYCTESRRLFVLHVHFLPNEYQSMKEVFDKLLSNLICHGKTWWLWSVYAFYFELPRDYSLQEYKILSAYGRMSFKSKKDIWYVLAYQGMANVVLEEEYNDIKHWFRERYLKEALKHYAHYKITKTDELHLRGHKCYRLSLEPRFSLIKKITLDSFVWLCTDSNRILALSVVAPEKMHPIISDEKMRVLKSIKCH